MVLTSSVCARAPVGAAALGSRGPRARPRAAARTPVVAYLEDERRATPASVRRVEAALEKIEVGHVKALEDIVSPEAVLREWNALGDAELKLKGLPAIQEALASIKAAVPDIDFTIHNYAHDETAGKVSFYFTEFGTQVSPVFGLPPPAKPAATSGVATIDLKTAEDGSLILGNIDVIKQPSGAARELFLKDSGFPDECGLGMPAPAPLPYPGAKATATMRNVLTEYFRAMNEGILDEIEDLVVEDVDFRACGSWPPMWHVQGKDTLLKHMKRAEEKFEQTWQILDIVADSYTNFATVTFKTTQVPILTPGSDTAEAAGGSVRYGVVLFSFSPSIKIARIQPFRQLYPHEIANFVNEDAIDTLEGRMRDLEAYGK